MAAGAAGFGIGFAQGDGASAVLAVMALGSGGSVKGASASARSAALANLRAGSFSRQRRITASRPAGRSGASARGGFGFLFGAFKDVAVDRRANDTASEFIRAKIREVVNDPDTAEKLVPTDHPFSSKRALIDTNYFETYNRDNVTLVDIRHSPIQEITPSGIRTEDETYDLDIIVFATGFDAMTGPFFKIDIRGRDDLALKEKWAEGPKTYLGVASAGFPNFFMITGPGSPSVLSNMPVSIEQHVEWIADCIESMRKSGKTMIEPTPQAQDEWVAHVNEQVSQTLIPLANSWYMSANIPGKPRIFMPYVGGVAGYKRKCDEIAAKGYEGFSLRT